MKLFAVGMKEIIRDGCKEKSNTKMKTRNNTINLSVLFLSPGLIRKLIKYGAN